MCGIAGFIDQSLSKQEGSALLASMMHEMQHRGPDNTGLWAENSVHLGHNRLSIIDLTPESNQPMEYEEFILTFNGEIYNYLELKEELVAKGHLFTTKSDTEVLVASYKEWGEKCVDRFVGMWAFALWDKKEKQLFCSRDRFGIKPFYYLKSDSEFYFASEVRALKKSNLFTNEININQASIFLQLGWYYNNEETLFSSVYTLPPASNIVIKNGNIQQYQYWNIDQQEKLNLTYEEKCAKLNQLYFDSIKLHSRSDVQVAACLSGGIDSSSIVSVFSTLYKDQAVEAFNIYYEGKDSVDERKWVGYVCDKYANVKSNFDSPTDQKIKDHFDHFMNTMEFPSNGSSPFSQYFVMKMVHEKGIKVVLNGQGADEYLAGYMHSMYRLFADYISSFKIGSFFQQFKVHTKNQGHSTKKMIDVLLKSILSVFKSEQSLYEFEYKYNYPNLVKGARNNPFKILPFKGSKLDQFLYHQVNQTSLTNLLHNEDVNSMAFSIESRVPFLDHRLVEFVFQLKNEDKIYNGKTKRILRDALKNELPKEILERKDKKGFVTPGEIKWLKGPLKDLLNIDWDKLDFLDAEKGKKAIEAYKKGELKNSMFIWRLCVLNYWVINNR